MKKRLTLFLLAGSLSAGAQLRDSFTDGDFSQDPAWTGDTELFEVNVSHQLHLDATAADTAFLSTPFACMAATEWRFWMKMSFNTSANNYARVYLASDRADLEGPLNGYFLQAGGSDDSLVLYRQQEAQLIRLTCCALLYTGHSTNALRFRITHDPSGLWEIRADSAGGENYFLCAEYQDSLLVSSNYFGTWCKFTSSNAGKFWFDDFYAGPVIRDSIPPQLVQVELAGDDTLAVFFSEPVDPSGSCNLMSYFLAGSGEHPADVVPGTGCSLLRFNSPFPEPFCDSLRITGIADLAGNTIADTSAGFCHYHPGEQDIVINEILADPFPGGSRFIELYNRCGMPVDLRELSLTYYSTDSSSVKVILPVVEPIFLKPQDYAVLCDDCREVADRYPVTDTGNFISVPSFPSLASKGGTIKINRVPDSVTMDCTVYSESMHHALLTSTEGISLERVSPDASPLDRSNWQSAAASAGFATPGTRNSQWWQPVGQGETRITLDPNVFSPDNDGKDDVLHIICRPEGNDFMATVVIYDSRGRRIRQVAGNERIASEGIFTWDGVTEERTKAPAGIYIVYAELMNMSGTVERFRETAVLAVKF